MTISPYFENRRTVRTFKKTDIPDSDIQQMLEAASHAPTTGNMQLYSVVVTRGGERRQLLDKAHFCQPASVNAPVLLTFCADFNRFVHWCEISNAKPGFDNLQSLVSAMLDTTILAQQFVTIAEQNGYGTCYLGTTTYNIGDIAKALELPRRVVPVTTIALGIPEGDSPASRRLPAEAFIHNDSYHDYTDEEIRSYYSATDNDPANRVFIEENDKQTLAQVFTDVRYPRQNNETFSEILREYLRDAGY